MRCLGLTLLCVLHISILHAQQRINTRYPFRISADYTVFRQTDTTVRMEVYFGFSSRLSTFELREQKYRSYVKIGIHIYEKPSQRLLLNEAAMLPIVLSDTSQESFQSSYITSLSYTISPGSYVLEVLATDSLGVGRTDTLSFAVEIPAVQTTTHISGLELCSSITEARSKESPFYKNTYEVMPSPGLLFGAGAAPVAFCYAEFYNLDTTQLYKVTARVLDRTGAILKSHSRLRSFKSRNIVDVSSLNMVSLASGKCLFQLILTDTLGKEFSKSEKQIFIYNPQLQSKSSASSSARIAEFAGMSSDELSDEFRKARYIALSSDEMTFEKLYTADALKQFLAQFWTEVEDGKNGRTDISRAIYLQRVAVANQRYRSLGKEGWQTDRGRIYLLYAEPDDIQRYPSSESNKPYETWEYHQIENGVIFVFVDRSGYGEYTLVHSTKRGELQDEGWERILR